MFGGQVLGNGNEYLGYTPNLKTTNLRGVKGVFPFPCYIFQMDNKLSTACTLLESILRKWDSFDPKP
jgi:hypothetical protein